MIPLDTNDASAPQADPYADDPFFKRKFGTHWNAFILSLETSCGLYGGWGAIRSLTLVFTSERGAPLALLASPVWSNEQRLRPS